MTKLPYGEAGFWMVLLTPSTLDTQAQLAEGLQLSEVCL